MEKHHIDTFFAEKLGNHSLEPRPEAWQKLENRLSHKYPQKQVWLPYSVAASVVLLLLAAVGWFGGQQSSPKKALQASICSAKPRMPTAIKAIEEGVVLTIKENGKNIEIIKSSQLPNAANHHNLAVVLPPEEETAMQAIEQAITVVQEQSKGTLLTAAEMPENVIELDIAQTGLFMPDTITFEGVKSENNDKKGFLTKLSKQIMAVKKGERVNWQPLGNKTLARIETQKERISELIEKTNF